MGTFLAELLALFSTSPLVVPHFPLLLALLACFTLLVTMAGLSSAFRAHKAHQELMQRIEGRGNHTSAGPREDRPTVSQWFVHMLKVVGEVNKPHSDIQLSMVRHTLMKAGYRGADAAGVFFGVKLYLAILVPLVYAVLQPLAMRVLPPTAFFLVLLAVVGFYLPGLWVRVKMRQRQRKVFEGFPDALDLMVVCVEAGLGLDAAIHKVGEEMQWTNRVLSEEFKHLELGLRAGQSRRLALLSLSRRVDVEEVNSFVALLLQTEQFGTSIAQALRVHADAMRLKRRQRAEEKATQLPVKLLFPLLIFIFPSLFVVILGPAIIRLMRVVMHMMSSAPTS
jgi:tight adherence protein C